ncbi:MAG TPA: hypothetical protein VM935_03080, partial [Chitinophagaceae bacterium]|nr:hypothetical protein [Chitinophagaceae bacterium]
MMNKLLLIGSLFICQLINGKVNGQDITAAKLPGLFNAHRSKTVTEKIYVHTDKEYYLAGETVWFKLYNVDGVLHKPISISKLAYVEILNAGKVPVMQAKIKLGEGSGHGSLQLPHTLASGNYILRAYTGWMKNFDADFYFEKNIAVLNTLSEEPIELAGKDSVDYDIQFFPEGGNLVSELGGKLAFRVVDKSGKGVDFKGAILDQKGDTVVLFSPLFKGIGSFSFLPSKGTSYQAVLTVPGNRKIIKDLPQVYETGYSLRVVNEAQRLLVKVQSRTAEPDEVLNLFVHTRGGAPMLLQGSLKDNLLQFWIDKDSLREGISHITLFNNKMQPLCERLFFKPFKKKLTLSAVSDSKIYSTRKKVTINIETKDETAAGVSSDLSLSVFHKDAGNSAPAIDIQTYLHLTSDLKGNIEDPAYYFSDTSGNVTDALDNLMLTQGWR